MGGPKGEFGRGWGGGFGTADHGLSLYDSFMDISLHDQWQNRAECIF